MHKRPCAWIYVHVKEPQVVKINLEFFATAFLISPVLFSDVKLHESIKSAILAREKRNLGLLLRCCCRHIFI